MPWSKTGGSKNHNKNARGREILMIKVFNGDAFGIQEEEYDRNTLLQFFLDGRREDFILVYRGEKLLKALSYYDILFNREVPEKVLYMNPDVFIQARDLIYAYGREEDRWRRALAVCDDNGEVLCLLYYLENCTSTVCPVSDFKRYGCEGRTDLTLLSQAETWVFEELEEYTYFLCHALEHFFPEKKKRFLDENALLFPETSRFYETAPADLTIVPQGNTLRVNSDLNKEFSGIAPPAGIFSSLDVMTSLFWSAPQSFGKLHPDKKFLLIRFPLYSAGLGDVITFCMDKLAMMERRKPDYIPVIDLSVPGDNNQFSGGRPENVWEYFFEPLNEYSGSEVLRSKHVLLLGDKIDAYNPYIMEQYYNPGRMRQICRKYLRLNAAMDRHIAQVRRRCFPQEEDARIMGVVARGTDYRHGGFEIPLPMDDHDFIDLVRRRQQEWDCPYVFLATEDADILDRFLAAGFGDKLIYVEQERYRYEDFREKGVTLAKMKKSSHDYRDEIPYLAVLYLLSQCTSLLANCKCGAFNVADFINGDRYEHRYCCGDRGTQWANKPEDRPETS